MKATYPMACRLSKRVQVIEHRTSNHAQASYPNVETAQVKGIEGKIYRDSGSEIPIGHLLESGRIR